MDGSLDCTDLVEKAQLGDEASMNRLAELSTGFLRRCVFRVTLDEAVTQDIVQEVMLEMFKVLGKLIRARAVAVCTKAGIGRKVGHKKAFIPANLR